MFGLSVVTMTFEDDTNDDTARAQVLERMQNVTLPTGAAWQIGANTTSTGEIFRYVITRAAKLQSSKTSALQDWVLEPAVRQVPGVGDVNAFGGGIKQYQVLVKPEQLRPARASRSPRSSPPCKTTTPTPAATSCGPASKASSCAASTR